MSRTICGYAAVYNSPTRIRPEGFIEMIKPGAFDEWLASGLDLDARINHFSGLSLAGRTVNKSLRLSSDHFGLWYEADLPSTSDADALLAEIDLRGGRGSSFKFDAMAGGITWVGEGKARTRVLTRLELFDVSPIGMGVEPAYGASTLGILKAGAAVEVVRQHHQLQSKINETRAFMDRRDHV